MVDEFNEELYLEGLAESLLYSRNGQASGDLLYNEAAIHTLFENLLSRSTNLSKKSFCILVMLLDYWKCHQQKIELPSIFYTYIEVIDEFIYFSSLGNGSAKHSFSYASKVLKEPTNPEPVLYFLPQKFFPERRLYRVTREDLSRIIKEKAWKKFPDPHKCENWVKLPGWYDELDIKSKATIRLSYIKESSVSRGGTESLSGKENVAQMIIQLRTARKRYRTGATLERGTSIFKPKTDVQGVSPTSRKASSQGFPETEELGSPLILPGMKISSKIDARFSPESESPSQMYTPRKELIAADLKRIENARTREEIAIIQNISQAELTSESPAFAIYEAGSTQELSFFSKPESLFESNSGSAGLTVPDAHNLGVSRHIRRYTFNVTRKKFIPK
jgi:hypothetical protein